MNPMRVILPVTKKPLQSRMGKGKGAITEWIARVNAGTVLLHFQSNLSAKDSVNILKMAKNIIRVKTRIIQGSDTLRVGE